MVARTPITVDGNVVGYLSLSWSEEIILGSGLPPSVGLGAIPASPGAAQALTAHHPIHRQQADRGNHVTTHIHHPSKIPTGTWTTPHEKHGPTFRPGLEPRGSAPAAQPPHFVTHDIAKAVGQDKPATDAIGHDKAESTFAKIEKAKVEKIKSESTFAKVEKEKGEPTFSKRDKEKPERTFPNIKRGTGGVDRSSIAKELEDNEALTRRYAQMTVGEINYDRASDRAKTVQAETAANRALKRGHSLEQALWLHGHGTDRLGGVGHGEAGYYPATTFNRGMTEAQYQDFKTNILPKVLAGSDEAKGFTGNASANVAAHQIAKGTPYMDLRSEGGDQYFDEDVGKTLPRSGASSMGLDVDRPVGVTRLGAGVAEPTFATQPGAARSNAIRMSPDRTAEGPHMELSTIDPRLRDIVGTGAANFEAANPGYTVEAFSGRRHGPGQGPHASEAGALDMQIRGPHGVIESRGSDPTGLYRELAKYARGVQLKKYPDLSHRFNWGGAFETSAGSGTPDLMHFDLSGVRGRYTPNLITNLPPK